MCTPRSNIVFLKTHKCASSSVQNLLLRYGVSNGKVFVLPSINNYLGHPTKFNRHLVPKPNGFEYNILAHHSRLNYSEMRALMPPDTIFITIIRDPVELFESMFSYYKLENYYKMKLTDFEKSDLSLRKATLAKLSKRYNDKIGLNQMMFDLGMDADDFLNYPFVIQYIQYLEDIFDLVLVAEDMDESLVLLKQSLCWDFSDMVVFKVRETSSMFCRGLRNTVIKINARASKTKFSPYARQFVRSLNWADNKLYRYFKKKHIHMVERYGEERMKRDVATLRAETQKW